MKDTEVEEVVTIGDHVIIQRLDFKKVYKVSENGCLALGKEEVKMSAIIGKPYWTTFKILNTNENVGKKSYKRNLPSTLVVAEKNESLEDLKNVVPSGNDNRTIKDDGKSQKLSKDEIISLRDSGKSGREIVSSLIENNSNFVEKTEYSQEKYIRKKEKKYCQFLTVLKPSISALQEIYFRQDPAKIQCIRMDTLAQMFSYCNLQSDGTYILYDTSSAGLVVSGMLSRIGANTSGKLVYLHPGDHLPQIPILRAMNFKQDQIDRLSIAGIFDFLKAYCHDNVTENSDKKETDKVKVISDSSLESVKNDLSEIKSENMEVSNSAENENNENGAILGNLKRKVLEDNSEAPTAKKSRKLLDLERAVEVIRSSKADGLAIVAKEHPLNIVQKLLKFLKASRPFVIYHLNREPLQETYYALKNQSNVVHLKLYSNFLRTYQVLPDRTHPDILMNDNGGYILTGYLVYENEHKLQTKNS